MFGKIFQLIFAPSSVYVIIRYVTYAMQFVNAVLLARYLDVFYFGIYSFIMLAMQYMSYSNLGINESLNTEYAAHKNDMSRLNDIWNNAWSINILLNIVIALACCAVFGVTDDLFRAYQFNDYKYLLLATCIAINLSKVYITYYKLHGRLIKLNIQQILPNLAIFVLLMVYREDLTIFGIVLALFVSNTAALLVFRIGVPVIPEFSLCKDWITVLIRRGVTLLLYNLSFYFLTLLASSIVSIYYSVETFGCYSFANTLVNGVVMSGGAFLFIFYPKILKRLRTENAESIEVIRKIREVYVVFMDLISLLSILCILAVSAIVAQYGPQLVMIYAILMLGRIVNNASTGYAALLIARGKEHRLVIYGFLSVLAVAGCGVCVRELNLPVEAVALSVVIASFIYTYLVVGFAWNVLGIPVSSRLILSEIFGMNKWLVCAIILLNAFVLHSYMVLIGCMLAYCMVNMKNIRRAIGIGFAVLSNKNALSF